MLALSTTLSMITPALALQEPSFPSGGASVFVDDVRVSAGEPATAKIHVKHDGIGVQTGQIKVNIPAATTGITSDDNLEVSSENLSIQPSKKLPTTGSGSFGWRSPTSYFTETDIALKVPGVSATTKIGLEVAQISGRAQNTEKNTPISLDKIKTVTGSFIVQYPVTVTIDGTAPAGASATVKTTGYDTGKATYNASGETTTTLTNNSQIWVDSGAGQQNAPTLNLTAPAGYKAEVKVGSGEWQLAGDNFSIGEVTAATNVSIRYTQSTADPVTVTVTDKYGEYNLGIWKQTGEQHATKKTTVSAKPYTGYTAYAYSLNGGDRIDGTSVEVPLTGDQAVTFFYKRSDNSAVVPGKDNNFGTKDDVTVKPTDPTKNPTVDNGTGTVTVPNDTTATVTRPKDPTNPDNGKENVIVPGGSTVDKDGTITLPGGGKVNPSDKLPENTPEGYVTVTYKANGGIGDDVLQIGKDSVNALGQQHTAPANKGFASWNTQENGNGTKYEKDATINKNEVLFAQWSGSQYTASVTITFHSNLQNVTSVTQTIGVYNGTSSTEKLRANSFVLSGWTFAGWSDQQIGEIKYTDGQAYTFKKDDAATLDLHAQWFKQDGSSITVPGKDGDPSNADTNVTGSGKGINRDTTTGVITIPSGGTIEVTKNGKTETILLPNGGMLNPDGSYTIKLPGGSKIEVDKDGNETVKDNNGNTKPDAAVATLVYKINNADGDEVTVKSLKDVETTAIANPFTYNGHVFLNWMATLNGVVTEIAAGGKFTPNADTVELHAQWAKKDTSTGAVELPGKDGILPEPNDKDNVVITPDQGGTVTPQPDGTVKVEDKDATVTRPDPSDPNYPNGDTKEEIKVPAGSVIKPDGTIVLPNNGGTIPPSNKLPDDVILTDYVVVTYEPNGGTGDVIKQVLKKNEESKVLGGDVFTAPAADQVFAKWLNEADNTTYTANEGIHPTANVTLKAQWKDKDPDPSVYTVTITYHSVNDTKVQQATGNSKQFSATLNNNKFNAPATDWTFMGWTTDANGGKNGTFYKDGDTIALDVTKDDPNLYALWYHKNGETNDITLPGTDKDPTTAEDNVVVKPGTGTAPTVKNDSSEGYVEAGDGNTITKSDGSTITVVNGPVKVYPDGTVYVPTGSKVTDKDGGEVNGPSTINPDGTVTPDAKDDPKKDTDNSIVIPGKDGYIDAPYDKDNLIVKPDGNGNTTGSVDNATGNTTITAPDGANVSIPGNNPPDTRTEIKLPQGTVIEPDGTITLPDDKDGEIPGGGSTGGGTIPGGSTIKPDGTICFVYTVTHKYIGESSKDHTDKVTVENGKPYTFQADNTSGYTADKSSVAVTGGDGNYNIVITYTKNTGSSGGGGGGGSVTSYVITASAGNGGSISPNGNVSVVRGSDKVFTITAKDGYRISNVIVDGESVGAVSTYTFRNVTAKHTIAASFIKVAEIPVIGPGDTGVDKWLRTDEHNSYITGYGNGLFGPENSVTRAQIAQIFYRLLKDQNVTATVNFSDVKPDAWYAEAVNALGSLGIISGVGKGKFDPDRAITRAEFCAVAARFAKVNSSADCPFDDVNTRDWYYQAVATAASYGWVTGMSDGSFHPNNVISRAQAATIINRMLGAAADRDFVDSHVSNPYKDVSPSYWAYYQIIEASIPHNHSYNAENVEIWNGLK